MLEGRLIFHMYLGMDASKQGFPEQAHGWICHPRNSRPHCVTRTFQSILPNFISGNQGSEYERYLPSTTHLVDMKARFVELLEVPGPDLFVPFLYVL